MRIKVFRCHSNQHKTLITLLLLNEINSKLGHEIATAYIVFPQEMVNISCKTPTLCTIPKIAKNYP